MVYASKYSYTNWVFGYACTDIHISQDSHFFICPKSSISFSFEPLNGLQPEISESFQPEIPKLNIWKSCKQKHIFKKTANEVLRFLHWVTNKNIHNLKIAWSRNIFTNPNIQPNKRPALAAFVHNPGCSSATFPAQIRQRNQWHCDHPSFKWIIAIISSWSSQIGSFPQVGVKIENIWNHQLVIVLNVPEWEF